jgi:imidazolonepropionase-like amidohydrolase
MRFALVGGNVFEGSGGPLLPGTNVLVEDSKIVGVTTDRDFGADTPVIDVTGKTVMPGLIDCHQHFAPWFQMLITEQNRSLMYHACRAIDLLQSILQSGTTSARDLGGLEAGFRDAINDGLIAGPRLKVALSVLQATNAFEILPGLGGLISPQEIYTRLPAVPSNFCDGVDGCRAKVRECLRWGADFIKILNDSFPSKRLLADRSPWTQAEVDAMCDEAHRAGVMVSAHAYRHDAVMTVLRAGADSIEEGCFLDEECITEMAKRQVWYVPCVAGTVWHADSNPDPVAAKYGAELRDGNLRALRLAMEAGVPIACGTDAPMWSDAVPRELEIMVNMAGMPVADALASATGRAADFIRTAGEVGRIKSGLEADLLVVNGDPLADVAMLRDINRLELVMQGGKPISGSLVPSLPKGPNRLPRILL